MGLFGGKKKEDTMPKGEPPKLPELPQLPELPSFPEVHSPPHYQPNQLPSIPSGRFGDALAKTTIKTAVGGDDERENAFMPKQRLTRELPFGESEEIEEQEGMIMENDEPERHHIYSSPPSTTEPVFIRVDNFEESLQIFQDTKQKLAEVESMLQDIKKIKEKEQEELELWEEELLAAKESIEEADQNLFSKIE